MCMETSHWDKFAGGLANYKIGQTDRKDKQRPGAPHTASKDAKLAQITEIITNDGWLFNYLTNSKFSDISSGTVFTILKKHFCLRKKNKNDCGLKKSTKIAMDSSLSNTDTGYETWIHYFEPQRKCGLLKRQNALL